MASAGRIDRLDLRLVRIEESIESIESALFSASHRLDGNIRTGCSEGGRYAKDAARLHPRWRRACDRQEVVLRHITEIERRLGIATTIAGDKVSLMPVDAGVGGDLLISSSASPTFRLAWCTGHRRSSARSGAR